MFDIDWSRLPPLTTLRAFEATARLEGYSAASRALNVTPAAIAQQVRKLEREIGTALVRREGRGLVLTQAGRQLSQPLQEAFSKIAKGIHDLETVEAARGVCVSTTDFFASSVALPRLGEFWAQHPKFQVSFSPDGNTAPVDLDSFDLVVRGGPPGKIWEAHAQVQLLETPMILTAAPALIGKGDVDVSALAWIRDRGIGGGVFEEAIRRAGCDPGKLRFVDPGDAKLELETAVMGYGVHFTPALTVRNQLAEGTLVKLDIDLGMRGAYYAIYRKGPVSGQVQRVLDWLIEICAPLCVDAPSP